MLTYLSVAAGAFALTVLLIPPLHSWALKQGYYDLPDHKLKTHNQPTPRLGGVAMFCAITTTLLATRFLTDYPTGTIRSLRYILIGGLLIFAIGLWDDLRRGGIHYRWKLLCEFAAAAILLLAPIRILFLQPDYLAIILSLLWVAGITNAINLIDIQDGLAGTQAAIASAAFLAISFPSEEIYVNILAAALLGAICGFLPYNFSSKRKMFMGDAGSLTLGYFLAVLALGSSYSYKNDYAVYAPLLILGVPIFETFFLIYIRLSQGLNPFKGSRDHTAHRLRSLRLSETSILFSMGGAALFLSALAFLTTRFENPLAVLWLYIMLAVVIVAVGRLLRNAKSEEKAPR